MLTLHDSLWRNYIWLAALEEQISEDGWGFERDLHGVAMFIHQALLSPYSLERSGSYTPQVMESSELSLSLRFLSSHFGLMYHANLCVEWSHFSKQSSPTWFWPLYEIYDLFSKPRKLDSMTLFSFISGSWKFDLFSNLDVCILASFEASFEAALNHHFK